MRDLELKRRELKERYDWYKAHGICTTCGRRYAEPGHVRCKECETQIAICHAKSREHRKELAKKRRQERIAAGICTECGRRKATEGMRMCPICRARRNDSTRKYKIGKKIEREAEKARNESRRRNKEAR